MSGASEEEDIKITADVLKVKEVENTYINSSKERMFDVVKLFVTNAEGSISLSDFGQIFKTVTVWIKFRPRKLGTYVEVMKERNTETTISVRYSADEYIPHVKEVLRDHNIRVKSIGNNVMVCQIPKPSDQDIEIAVQKVKVLANTARSSLSQVKADTIQRLQAALKNEYLEAKDVKYALTSIEKVEQQMAAMLTYFRLENEKKLSGRKFEFDTVEAKDIWSAVSKKIKKNGNIEI
jgi:ribosome recycling factor|tara:strand:- start:3605 stop:4312 length:708 start_codon:yes stop_codon:yes gene_type:complete